MNAYVKILGIGMMALVVFLVVAGPMLLVITLKAVEFLIKLGVF